MKYFLMRPPRWIERILSKFPAYREWYIREVCKLLREDVIKSFEGRYEGGDME